MSKATLTEENWELYKLYVNEIHNKDKDEEDKSSFKRWLCSQNIKYETMRDS